MMIDDLFYFSEKILSDSEIDTIKNYILENEQYIKQLGPDEYGGTSEIFSLEDICSLIIYIHKLLVMISSYPN